MSIEEQKSILLHFYKSTCGSILPAVSSSSVPLNSVYLSLTHKPVETYTVHEVYVCVFMLHENFVKSRYSNRVVNFVNHILYKN